MRTQATGPCTHTHIHIYTHAYFQLTLLEVGRSISFLCMRLSVCVCLCDMCMSSDSFSVLPEPQSASVLPRCGAAVLSVRWHFSKFKQHKKYSLNNIQICVTFRITLCYLFAQENVCLSLASLIALSFSFLMCESVVMELACGAGSGCFCVHK